MKRFFTEHGKTLWLLLLFVCMFILGRGIGAITYGLRVQHENKTQETAGTALENTEALLFAENWGLGFGVEGTQPTGTASAEKLKEYNAYYVGDAEEKKIYLTFDEGYENGYTAKILDTLKEKKCSAVFFVTMPYNEAEQKVAIKLSTHQGQEMDIVIKGKMRVQIGSHIEELGEGDSIYYNSGTPHGMIAVGGEECTLYAVVMRPQKEKKPEKDTFEALIKAKQDRADRETVASPFVHTELDENGILKSIDFMNEKKFNFAFDIVDKMAEKEPDKLAMLWVSKHHEEKRFTFNDMKRMSNKTANYFKSLGIKRGDRVMLILKRHYQFWFAILALHKLGAVVIPATNLLMEHDLDYRFKAAGVRALVCTPDGQVADEALRAAKNCGTVEFLMMANGAREGWLDFDAEVEKQSDVFERTEDTACGSDPMLMFFTSGTTGYPKIAEHNYKYALGHYITAKYWHNVNPEGLHFTISDTGWGKALWGKLYGQWMCEAPIFTYDFDKFDAHDILPMFKQYNITTFCAPPTMYRFFIKEDLSKYDLSSIEYSTTAGEALNPEVYEQWKRATGLSIYEGFGQTETTLSIYNPVGSVPKSGSMGIPSPLYDVDLILPDGTPAPVGETGEIVIRTDKHTPCGLFMGYYRDEEKTREAWSGGVYHTGDTAWRDEDGYFFYVGRTDDVIKSSGYRIGPFEIENVIMELPYVLECGVSAAPDEIRGQVVKASIVLVPGTEGTDELKKEIQNYVKQHTAPYKYPRIVVFRDELPKTISGKIIRNQL